MIKIQNIYYMLSYAFQVLNENTYKDVATESFDNVADLCSAILIKGVSSQLKRGLGREYIEETETLSSIKGKIDISASIKDQSIIRRQLVCSYDDFSINTYMNRIIKSTMLLLLHGDISKARKKEIKKLLVYLNDVDEIDLHTVNWKVQYNKNNQSYRMLVSVCYLVVKGLLQTQSDGTTKLMDFIDEQRMSRLYEKFILEYYKKEHPKLHANASQIDWQLEGGNSDSLPILQTDIMLSKGNNVLIIDAKYYGHTWQSYFETEKINSGNLFQMFTYVKNKEAEFKDKPHKVSGLILYARTDEEKHPDERFNMSGNTVSVKTLDLNTDFSNIKKQLDDIAHDHFKFKYPNATPNEKLLIKKIRERWDNDDFVEGIFTFCKDTEGRDVLLNHILESEKRGETLNDNQIANLAHIINEKREK